MTTHDMQARQGAGDGTLREADPVALLRSRADYAAEYGPPNYAAFLRRVADMVESDLAEMDARRALAAPPAAAPLDEAAPIDTGSLDGDDALCYEMREQGYRRGWNDCLARMAVPAAPTPAGAADPTPKYDRQTLAMCAEEYDKRGTAAHNREAGSALHGCAAAIRRVLARTAPAPAEEPCIECRTSRFPHPHRCPKCGGTLWQAPPACCQDCGWESAP